MCTKLSHFRGLDIRFCVQKMGWAKNLRNIGSSGSPTKTKAVTVCGLNIKVQLVQTSPGRASVDIPLVVQRKEKQCWGDHWSLASKRQN